MRFFWKIILITTIPIGGYWLYKKSKRPSEIEVQSEPEEEGKKEVTGEQVIERLTEIDGVTSRVAEHLVEKGIYTGEDLKKLTKEELMEIKGIGPKRAEKILKL